MPWRGPTWRRAHGRSRGRPAAARGWREQLTAATGAATSSDAVATVVVLRLGPLRRPVLSCPVDGAGGGGGGGRRGGGKGDVVGIAGGDTIWNRSVGRGRR